MATKQSTIRGESLDQGPQKERAGEKWKNQKPVDCWGKYFKEKAKAWDPFAIPSDTSGIIL